MTGAAVIVFLLGARLAHAVGETALDAANFATGARAAGMGGAATASSKDATALQWNPAGLAGIEAWGASLSHLAWVAGISYSYVGVAVPVPAGLAGLPVKATAGASVQAFDYGSVESTRGFAAAVEASDVGCSVGGAASVAGRVAAGAALRYFKHSLAQSTASEVALDLGGTYELVPGLLKAAAVVQNLGYASALEGVRPPLPVSLRTGIELRVATAPDSSLLGSAFGDSAAETLVLTVDTGLYRRGEPASFNAGVELGLYDFFFGRLGYLGALRRTGGNGGICAGMGIAFGGVRLDYAYGSVGDLGRAQYATLSWAPVTRKKGPAGPRLDPETEYREATALYSTGHYAEAALRVRSLVQADPGHWRAWQLLGNCRYAQGNTEGARQAYRASLKINPGNAALERWLESLP